MGLLRPVEREGAGYRYYDDEAVARLEKILALKRLGLSLDDISQVIDLYFSEPSGVKGKEKVLEILEAQLQSTRSKLGELQKFESDLMASIARMQDLIREAREAR
jgi:DNA-binding transcriptional MerR regulator